MMVLSRLGAYTSDANLPVCASYGELFYFISFLPHLLLISFPFLLGDTNMETRQK